MNLFLKKIISIVLGIVLLTQSLAPYTAFLSPRVARAEEITPTDTLTPSPTPDPSIVTETPTPTPEETTVTPTDIPTETATPTPDQTSVTTTPVEVTPIDTSTPAPSGLSPPDDSSLSDDSSKTTGNEDLNILVLENVSAPSIDLEAYQAQGSASLITDKPDYAPTDTAFITGSGLKQNSPYSLTISSDDPPATSSTVQVQADENGAFVYAYQLDGIYRPNYSAELKDSTGTIVATVTFTDSTVQTEVRACMQDNPSSPSSLVCTANDVSVANVNNIQILDDGCNAPGDTVTFTAAWDLQSTSSERYDIGLYFATQGQSSALNGTCSVSTLANSPTPPWSNLDGDACGDITSASQVHPVITMTATCNPDPTTGLLKMPYCTSWDNNAGGVCSAPADAYPSTKSKCNCQDGFTVNIPVPPAIEVIKNLVPSNDSGKFNLQVNSVTKKTDAGNTDTTGKVGVATGQNTFGETGGTGTNLNNYTSVASCVLRGTQTPVTTVKNGNTWAIANVTNGQDIVCTVANTRINNGSITIIKDAVPNDAQDFHFTTTGTGLSAFDLDDDSNGTLPNTTTFSNLGTGTYSVSEEAVTGWTSDGGVCSDGSPVSAIALSEGENVTCTFTNTLNQTHLTLAKTVTNDNGGTASATDWTLSASGPTPISGTTGNSSVTNALVTAGTYTLSESGPSNYTAGSWACVGGTQNGDQITLAPGDDATCTITNDDNAPSLTLNKIVINDNGGSSPESAWTLTATGPTTISGAGAAGSTDVVSASSFKAGTYILSESAGPTGYNPSDWTCSNGDNDDITDIALGDEITCTITNDDQQSYIIVDKTVINDNGGNATPDSFNLTVDTGVALDGVAVPVNPGVHTVGETLSSGYTAGTWGRDCNANGSVTVGLGETKTCTITNNDIAPKLHLRKIVINDNGGTATTADFTLTANGTGSNDLSGTSPVDGGSGLLADVWTLSETPLAGYTASAWVCVGGKQTGSDIKVDVGGEATCTIANDDIAPILTYTKLVTNNYGGTLGSTNFPLFINNNLVTSGTPNTLMANFLYTLTETQQSGYAGGYFTGDCNAAGSISLLPGDNKTCYISNTDVQPKLTVTKVVINDNGGQKEISDFPLSVGTTGVKSGAQNGFNAGTYIVSEVNQTGYTATISGDCDPTSGSITLAVGDVKSCTITNNDQPGHLIVNKVTIPSDTTTEFSITATGGAIISPSATQIIVGGGTVNYTVNAGTYSVTEAEKAGWDETGNTCVDVVIANGETKECTITNTKRAHIIIVKDVIGNPDPTDFTFHNNFGNGNPATFLLDEDDNGTLPNSRDFEVLPGEYLVTEDSVANWQSPESASCNQDETIDSINVGPGETVTCTFVNEELATIVLVKNTVGGDGSFDFDATGAGLPADIDLTTVAGTDSQTFTGLDQDNTYSIAENVPAGWALTSSSCTGTNTPTSITPDAGETVTCTFTNNKPEAQIDLTPLTDTNKIGDNHVITANVQVQNGNGTWGPAADGTLVTFELTNSNGATATFNGGVNTCTTTSGSCSVTINSPTPGNVSISASSSPVVLGVTIDVETGTGGDNSADAEKDYVNARIRITPDNATNAVNDEHNFTVTVEQNTGSGWDPVPAGTLANAIVNPATSLDVSDCNDGVNASGQCTVTVNSGNAGVFTIIARSTVNVNGVVFKLQTSGAGENSEPAVKTYVDASIALSPQDATNNVGDPHTITAHVAKNDGSGTTNAEGVTVTFTVTTGTADFIGADNDCVTNADGNCSVQIVDNTPGANTIDATTTFSVGGVSLTRATNGDYGPDGTDRAEKTYVAGKIIVEKQTLPDGSQQSFEFNPSWSTTNFTLTDGQQNTSGWLAPGAYSIEEIVLSGWDLTDTICVVNEDVEDTFDPRADEFILNADDIIHCTFTNTRSTGTIIVHKIIDADGDLGTTEDQFDGEDWEMSVEGNSEDTSNPDSQNTDVNGETTFDDLKTGDYNVFETLQDGYDMLDAYCDEENGSWDGGLYGVEVGKDDVVNCTFINTPNGTLHGRKWDDGDKNGVMNEIDSLLSGWTINLYKWNDEDEDYTDFIDSFVTDDDEHFGWYWFEHLFPGDYKICEELKSGWKQTYPGEDSCHYVSLPEGASGPVPTEQILNAVLGPAYDFGNTESTPILTISKTNDAVGDKSPNDIVTYTLTVTASKEGGPADNVKVTDLLPKGFVYVPGSWQAFLNDVLNGAILEPTYASPGVWTLGHMDPGDVYKLVYQAKIDGTQATGRYYDNAWAQGTAVESSDLIYAQAINPGQLDSTFVGTDVNIVNPDQLGTSYKSTQEVLGASILPATGENTLWVIFATLFGLTGIGSMLVGLKLKRSKNE